MCHVPTRQRKQAKRMRSNPTDAETVLWEAIRAGRLEGLKFRRQVPFGPFITDFACHDRQLIVEVDGSGHARDDTTKRDAARTRYLEAGSYTVIRFWNDDVLRDLDVVCLDIVRAATSGDTMSIPFAKA